MYILVSAGFDAALGDPLGGCAVTNKGYAHMTYMLKSLAGGKVVVALEGGYNLSSISISSAAVTSVLLGLKSVSDSTFLFLFFLFFRFSLPSMSHFLRRFCFSTFQPATTLFQFPLRNRCEGHEQSLSDPVQVLEVDPPDLRAAERGLEANSSLSPSRQHCGCLRGIGAGEIGLSGRL